ncbi:hypothetical protein H4R18_004212 [Coemansia javaensis]|uniref:Cation-transporting ATPase n=1 Tax=Coemansia javaensis TaxID=2761396 RepID=A0A9W8LGJ7_9FUNG|nr:hypothetical protein H4R18_004212 [Coemansia javaensis]
MRYTPVHESLQEIHLGEDQAVVVVRGRVVSQLGRLAYWAAAVATAGVFYIVGRWFPGLYARVALRPAPLAVADRVQVLVDGKHASVEPVSVVPWHGQLEAGFGAPKELPPGERAAAAAAAAELRSFGFRHYRFVYCPALGRYVATDQWKDPGWCAGAATGSAGLGSAVAAQRALLFGQCVIAIEDTSYLRLLWDEALNPFYIFQVASIAIWCSEEYYYYSGVIFAISALSIAVTLVTTKRTIRRIRDMAAYICQVGVLRDGVWRTVPSSELVPGDIVDVSALDHPTLPCEALLLEGDCIVDESMLTGECIPESKAPLAPGGGVLEAIDMGAHTFPPGISRHILFAGTRLVRVRTASSAFGPGGARAAAMVLRTGFCTTRGSLVRSILFPGATRFQFYRDALRFVWILAGIALVGLTVNSVNLRRLGVSASEVAKKALDIVTVAVPPALPASMSIGMALAARRLRKVGIFCISPSRINVASKVSVMVFDKTNTLTEAGLDLLGAQAADRGVFLDPAGSSAALAAGPFGAEAAGDGGLSAAVALATCHSLHVVDGALIGDPLETKMLEFTGWRIEEGDGTASLTVAYPPDTPDARLGAVEVARVFEFAAELRRSSVVVRRLDSSSSTVYVKGAPETMRGLCIPATVPADFEQVLDAHTQNGYRVIALAGRRLEAAAAAAADAGRLERAEVERDLTFMCLLVFENRLKPATVGALRELKGARIRLIMCTGDSPLTAVSIARECRLVDDADSVFVSRLVEAPAYAPPLASVSWRECGGSGSLSLDPDTLAPVATHPADAAAVQRARALAQSGRYRVAVTGDVFAHMEQHARDTELWRHMLMRGAVYARVSPEQKGAVVGHLQALGYMAGFCGDGANDCVALRAADVGISLGEAEASVAAPFTSSVTDISCVAMLLKEGRCSIATSFSCFKFMALYSIIQFTTCCLVYTYNITLTNGQFLFGDLFTVLPIAICIDRFEPFGRLVPKRPTARLTGKRTLTSLIGNIALVIGFQVAMFFMIRTQAWYQQPRPADPSDPDSAPANNTLNTTLFLLSSLQYLAVGVAFSIGPPYRQPAWRNALFVAVVGLLLAFDLWAVLGPVPGLRSLLGLVPIAVSWRFVVLGMAAANFVLCYAGERLLFPWLAPRLARACRLASGAWRGRTKASLAAAAGEDGAWAQPGQRPNRKLYKILEQRMAPAAGPARAA